MTGQVSIAFDIDGLSCASCAARAERTLVQIEGIEAAQVNFATGTATVTSMGSVATGEIAGKLKDAGYPPREHHHHISVEGLHCASCVSRAERALLAVPGVMSAAVNLATAQARVTVLSGAVEPSALTTALAEAGFTGRLGSEDTDIRAGQQEATEAEGLFVQALLAALLALPVFVLEMGGHLVPAFHHWIAATIGLEASWLLQFGLTSAVLLGPGRLFYRLGWPALLRGAPDMNSLVMIGTLSAWAYSTLVLFAPELLPVSARAVYFEAAAVIVVLILVGRALEARARGRTGVAIRALMDLRPDTARVVGANGNTDTRPVAELQPGDVILARPGDRIAVDGVVIEGTSHVDESMLTGEAIPVSKMSGDALTGGTLNGHGRLVYRAERVGADTVLAQITRMVADAQAAKLPVQARVDQITLWFVPAVIAAALLTVVLWLLLGPEPALTHALVAGVAVLIIACPCAMGLATPTSIMVGLGRAASLGVLFRRGDALERLGGVRMVAFDKTGTLTAGQPVLSDFIAVDGMDRRDVLTLLAAAEAGSEHHIAHAVQKAAIADGITGLPEQTEFTALPGLGLQAEVEGSQILVGAERLMAANDIDVGALRKPADRLREAAKSPIFLTREGHALAVFAISDPVRASTAPALAALRAKGLEVAMITGDEPAAAQAVARALGIDRVIAGVPPEGKAAALAELKAEGGKLAFVGDGINDGPALAAADVGIAVGTGTNVAIEAADVVLMSEDLGTVPTAFDVSRATMRNVRQNLFWAFAYNAALIPVAAGALYPLFGLQLSPMLAAAAMALSSVFVVSNALRLRSAGGTNSTSRSAPTIMPVELAAT